MENEASRRARKEVGRMLDDALIRVSRDINWLAIRVNAKPVEIRNLLAGVPNPKRPVFEKVVGVLELSKQQKRAIYNLLDIFSPTRPSRRIVSHSKI